MMSKKIQLTQEWVPQPNGLYTVSTWYKDKSGKKIELARIDNQEKSWIEVKWQETQTK